MKIFVGINTLTEVSQIIYANHCQFWFRAARQFPDASFAFFAPRRMSIDNMRNQSVKLALAHEFDYVLFIDDDVTVPLDSLPKLIKADKDIIAGHTIIRGYPYNSMAFKYDEEGKKLLHYNDMPEGIVKVDAVGCSYTLIKSELLRKIPPPYFVTGVNHTEDIYFCLKAAQFYPEVGIYVDTTIKTGHLLNPDLVTPDNLKSHKKYDEEENPWVKEDEEQTGDNNAKYVEQLLDYEPK